MSGRSPGAVPAVPATVGSFSCAVVPAGGCVTAGAGAVRSTRNERESLCCVRPKLSVCDAVAAYAPSPRSGGAVDQAPSESAIAWSDAAVDPPCEIATLTNCPGAAWPRNSGALVPAAPSGGDSSVTATAAGGRGGAGVPGGTGGGDEPGCLTVSRPVPAAHVGFARRACGRAVTQTTSRYT